MTEYTFSQLVDLTRIKQLLESHHRVSRMAYGLSDADDIQLLAVGWQEACSRLHLLNPQSSACSPENDPLFTPHLHDPRQHYFEYRCNNGMIYAAVPIFIEGRHLASLFTGQLYYHDEGPQVEWFRQQAETLGLGLRDYLEALERVPVFSREHVRGNLLFLRDMLTVLAETGLEHLKLKR